ncbi:MAG: DUF4097 domain-containing protein [Saccharofermentans sp.]|nr:DUF4097 domain-containing protein [Saccharofermentans sp.]
MKTFKRVATGFTAATLMMSMMTFTACSKDVKFVTDEEDFSESFSSINIDATMENVKILKSEDDETHVKFRHADNFTTTIEVKNDTLVISEKSGFNLINFADISDDDVYLEIYLSEDNFDELDIDVASADIYAVDGIDFDVIDIDTASGDVHLKDMNAGSIKIDTASGDIGLANVLADSFDFDTASGCVNFDKCDADEIDVDTASGDVTGSFLSDKKFDVDTASGDINTPRSSNGGVCKIDTASGDVDLEIA